MVNRIRNLICQISLISLTTTGCSSVLKHKDAEKLNANREFDQVITIRELAPPGEWQPGAYFFKSAANPIPPPPQPGTASASVAPREASKKAKKVKAAAEVEAPPTPRQPEIEDSIGFEGRRPIKDPFRVGEKVTFEVSYFGLTAGDMTLEVRPFVEVNGRKSYHFVMKAISRSMFAAVYTVDDWAETFIDFETLLPYSYSLHVKESKQLRETRNVFNWKDLRAYYWDKKVTKDWGIEEKKEEWSIEAWSQNIFSAPFYLRNFSLEVGKKYEFWVSHEGKNFLVTGEVIRREILSTDIGKIDTFVIKPKVALGGVFHPVGDIFMWLTADDRKMLVRMESKIKIGTIVAAVKKIEKGSE